MMNAIVLEHNISFMQMANIMNKEISGLGVSIETAEVVLGEALDDVTREGSVYVYTEDVPNYSDGGTETGINFTTDLPVSDCIWEIKCRRDDELYTITKFAKNEAEQPSDSVHEQMDGYGYKNEMIQQCTYSCNCIFTDLLKDFLSHKFTDEELDKWGGNMEYDDIIYVISRVKEIIERYYKARKTKRYFLWHWSREEYGAWGFGEEMPNSSKVMIGYEIGAEWDNCGGEAWLYKMTPIVPTKTIETEYCEASDRTFLIESIRTGDNVISEEVIGFYSGMPTEELTSYYSEHRSLKAMYD